MVGGDSITILTHPVALATKRHFLGTGSKPQTQPYGKGEYFKAETIPLEGLHDLADLLELLVGDPRAFCVRGELIPGTDLMRVRRAKKANKEGERAGLREIPRRWVMIDVDTVATDATELDWSTPAGCDAGAAWALGKLPPELRQAGHIWQASSSAGLKPGVKFHFWFWLDRPLGEIELVRWGKAANDLVGYKLIDIAVFYTVQPLYVATPVFENVLDPVAKRLGYVPGPVAALPRLQSTADQWKRKLEPLYYESNETLHEHLRDACASYFCGHGPDADAQPLRAAMRTAVDYSCSTRGVTDSKYDDAKLEEYMQSGRDFSQGRAAAGENLLLDKGGEPKGNIANMLAVMRSHPDWQQLLAWNTRAARIEILRTTAWGSPPGDWIDAADSVRACEWFAREKRMGVDDGTLMRAAVAYAREAEIDPAAEELKNFEWDGVHRMDDWLSGWCGAEDSEYTRRVGRMFLIGCVARALRPGCKHDTVIVLQGETGIGKSTLLEILGGKYYAALNEEKDMLQKIHGPWIVELQELGPFRFMHYNRIKGFTSTRIDRFRAPYMRDAEDRPRSCVLAATLNPEGFGWQQDPTSGRRFWPVDVTTIDRAAITAAREQLFAEAVVAFHSGEAWWVEDPKDPIFLEQQARVFAVDAWETIFQREINAGGKSFGPGGRMVSLEKNAEKLYMIDLLAVAFENFDPSKRDQERAAHALTRLGYKNHGAVWHKLPDAPPVEDVLTQDDETDRKAG